MSLIPEGGDSAALLEKEPQSVNLSELQNIFENLQHRIGGFRISYGNGAALCREIKEEVSKNPILVCIKSSYGDLEDWEQYNGRTMLTMLVSSPLICAGETPGECSIDLMHFLLEKNPYALAWEWHPEERDDGEIIFQWNTMKFIARFRPRLLLDQILPKYSWIMEHPNIKRRPPHMELLWNSIKPRETNEFYAGVSPEDMLTFFQKFPQLLNQEATYSSHYDLNRSTTPLLLALCHMQPRPNSPYCNAAGNDVIEWMIENAAADSFCAKEPWNGGTVVHVISALLVQCFSPQNDDTGGTSKDLVRAGFLCSLCRKAVVKNPNALTIRDTDGCFSMHYLERTCHIPMVQDLIIFMLRYVYLQDPGLGWCPAHSPFLAGVYGLLKKEDCIHQEIIPLKMACGSSSSGTPSSKEAITKHEAAGKAFKDWAEERMNCKFSCIPRVKNIREKEFSKLKARFTGR